jgi:hypothetical protein
MTRFRSSLLPHQRRARVADRFWGVLSVLGMAMVGVVVILSIEALGA